MEKKLKGNSVTVYSNEPNPRSHYTISENAALYAFILNFLIFV
jgi:hypothetical protein